MTTTTLRRWNSRIDRVVQFLGWKEGSNRSVFFALDGTARRQISLIPVKLQNLNLREPFIPDLPIVCIERAVLHLPACYPSTKDSPPDGKGSTQKVLDRGWTMATRHAMYLTSTLEKQLHVILRKQNDRIRNEFEAERAQLEDELACMAQQIRHEIDEMSGAKELLSEQERGLLDAQVELMQKNFAKLKEDKKQAFEARYTIATEKISDSAIRPIRTFEITMRHIKEGYGGLLSKFLSERWAAKHGVDPSQIRSDAASFKRWFETIAWNTRIEVQNHPSGLKEFKNMLRLPRETWEVLWALVNYRVIFSDGSRIWLHDFIEGNLQDEKSVHEFATLLQVSAPSRSAEVTMEDVRTRLSNENRKPPSDRWIRVLCRRASLAYPPKTSDELEKVAAVRDRQRKSQSDKLKARNAMNVGARIP